jgi:hypothetical protein
MVVSPRTLRIRCNRERIRRERGFCVTDIVPADQQV